MVIIGSIVTLAHCEPIQRNIMAPKDLNTECPVNLDLVHFKFPLAAIVSILHRISGIVLFLFLPVVIYLLSQLNTQASFNHLMFLLSTHFVFQLTLWVLLSSVLFHLFAGIRHLVMDLGYADSANAGRVSAIVVLLLAVFVMILLGLLVW